MGKFNHFAVPLSIAKERINFIKAARKSLKMFEGIVYEVSDSELTLSVKDATGNFYFHVRHPRQATDSNKAFFDVLYYPASEMLLAPHKGVGTQSQILASLGQWLSMMKDYHHLPEDPDFDNLRSLEEEIEVDFAESKDNSATEFFSSQKQEIIYDLLQEIKVRVAIDYPNDSEAEKIIDEVTGLQVELTKLPKKTIRQRIIKIMARFKKHSIKMGRSFANEAQKKFFDRILSGKIIDDGRKTIEYIQEFF